jgi:transposase InsO family protein
VRNDRDACQPTTRGSRHRAVLRLDRRLLRQRRDGSVWSTLKRELAWIHDRTHWSTRAELRAAIFEYVEGFYNRERTQKRLDYQSPFNYEHTSAA